MAILSLSAAAALENPVSSTITPIPISTFEDLECPTAHHCVAAGVIDDKKGHEQGAVVVSSDGGLHWSQYEVKEHPLSLFFLNDTLGWMVTDRGLWSTVEGGRAWTKVEIAQRDTAGVVPGPESRVHHGIGQGLVQETMDGGKDLDPRWKLRHSRRCRRRQLRYRITFQGAHGIIIGEPDGSARPAPVFPRSPAIAGRSGK